MTPVPVSLNSVHVPCWDGEQARSDIAMNGLGTLPRTSHASHPASRYKQYDARARDLGTSRSPALEIEVEQEENYRDRTSLAEKRDVTSRELELGERNEPY